MIYNLETGKKKRGIVKKVTIAAAILLVIVLALIAVNIYLEIMQLDEIGGFSGIYLKNLEYQVFFFAVCFVLILAAAYVTTVFVKRNIKEHIRKNSLPDKKVYNLPIAVIIAFFGALASKETFFLKALSYFNSTPFGTKDPLFSKDIGFYVFQRPFLMSIYSFFSGLWLFIIFFTAVYYLIMLFSIYGNEMTTDSLRIKSIIRHNLFNIAIFFLIRTFSYEFQKQGLLYSGFFNVKGAGYVKANVWLAWYSAAPFIVAAIVVAAFIFILRNRLKAAAITIAAYPALWIVVVIIAAAVQGLVVQPNEYNYEKKYLEYNMEKTREAYKLDKAATFQFPAMQKLTPEILNRNMETKNNIRVVDFQATLDTDIQLQSNTNFYNFHNGDIINYNINGSETPIFITAREIDKNRLPEKSYINTMFKYTHGYGVVINPINRLTSEGQADYILNGLRMDSEDKNLKITQPRIYYGELTDDQVIVNAGEGLNEIDYDGNSETRYDGKGGIKMSFLNKLLFAAKYGDFNMLISGYIKSDSKLLLNREILSRVQKAMPFLMIDPDPYIIPTKDGRLLWVIDAYTATDFYPYSQDASEYGTFNYIRNSVKIVIDAYDGKAKFYIIDKDDPIVKTYSKIYPGAFSREPLPKGVLAHMRYPELLFKIQTEILKRYHLDPKANPQNVAIFYSNQDLWTIAKYPQHTDMSSGDRISEASDLVDIDPYYNMVKLPGNIGKEEELILMRPFTPSGSKNNMVSWLSVRNDAENYGELVLFNFPKNTNILGPYQVESNINSIDKVSKDMTLWGQSGSRVFKGSLLVIPIENTVLYVEPIYIQSAGTSSIPQMREIIVGYQNNEEFKYGIGNNLDDALNQLFSGMVTQSGQGTAAAAVQEKAAGEKTGTKTEINTAGAAGNKTQEQQTQAADKKLLDDIKSRLDELKKQTDELGKLINQLEVK